MVRKTARIESFLSIEREKRCNFLGMLIDKCLKDAANWYVHDVVDGDSFIAKRFVFFSKNHVLYLCPKKQDMSDFSYIPSTSVVTLPGARASAAFLPKTSEVFKEEHNIVPIIINDKMKYIPWGGDNQMPYNIIDLIESDETMSTCQMFNAEVCYGSGLVYDTELATAQVQTQVNDFMLDNDLASYFLGVCQDFKHFGFCVSVIILNEDASRIVRIVRKQACYVRFASADKSGVIPYILYANWRNTVSPEDIERIELLNPQSPFTDLQNRGKRIKKFAVVSRIPTPDNTYYPIPYYASLFKGKWYNIKQLIGIAKEAKLKNSAPIKYHIEIAKSFWSNIFKAEGITDRVKQQERVNEEKDNIINFLTGMENSGKVLFSEFYVSPNGEEQHDVVINKIETGKKGGDCFANVGCARQSSSLLELCRAQPTFGLRTSSRQ